MRQQDTKSKLRPFKKIVERDYSGHTGKGTYNERFAPCAGDRCMAYRSGHCQRLENGNRR